MPFDFPDPDKMTMDEYETTRNARPYPVEVPPGMDWPSGPPAGGHSHDEDDAVNSLAQSSRLRGFNDDAVAVGICEDCCRSRIGFDHRLCIVNAFRAGRFRSYQDWRQRCTMMAIALNVVGPPHPLPGALKVQPSVTSSPTQSVVPAFNPLRGAAVRFPRVSL